MSSKNEDGAQVSTDTEQAQVIADAVLSLPVHAVEDLLSIGVCVRCILRLFGVHERIYSCSLLSPSILYSTLKETKSSHKHLVENGFKENEDSNSQHSFKELESEPVFCGICLGLLQFSYSKEKETLVTRDRASDFTASIAELVKREGHEIDSFSLEISIPPIILANEHVVWLYMKRKYGSELWFQEKFLTERISVKDALKLSITNSLETLLIETGIEADLNSVESSQVPHTECSEHSDSEVDRVIHRSLNGLQDHVVCERFKSLPEKVDQPCHLEFHCYRTSIYIGGRYLKYSRNVSQTRWIIDDERMGEASVEEIIGSGVLPVCRGDNYKFHAAGREDIDVRMLGSGRPFLVEVQNARHAPSTVSIKEMEEKINNSEAKLVRVRNLKVVGSQGWTVMREGEAEKQKQYAALVWISRPLEDEDLQTISSRQDMLILQRTPIRVLHRRSPLEREKLIHWMKIERIVGSSQYFLLHLCTQAGTYIKEFVHGDLGRTHPSVGTILSCRAEILQLDVTDVKMDCFN